MLEPPGGLEERTRRRWQPGLGFASSSPIRQLFFPGSQLELGKDSRPDRLLLPGGREPIFPPAIMRLLPHLPRFITKRAQLFSQSVGLPIRGSRPAPRRHGDQSPLSPVAEAQPGRVELSLGWVDSLQASMFGWHSLWGSLPSRCEMSQSASIQGRRDSAHHPFPSCNSCLSLQ